NNVVRRKAVSVEGLVPGFKVPGFQSFKDNAYEQGAPVNLQCEIPKPRISETLLFLRCVEQWLTMCKGVVIIKQFREFESFEEIRARQQ
ncbi:MAG: hypothetical protein WBQ39_16715, partial [Terriglobales bacterium]